MCVALPGTVIRLEGRDAIVDFSGNRVSARAGLVPVQPGDRVLVHAGIILQKLSEREAQEVTEVMREVGGWT